MYCGYKYHQTCIDLTVLAWSICNLLGLDYHVIMIKFVRQNRKFCVIMIIKDERKCQLPAECPQTTWRCLSGFFGALQVLHYHFIIWFSECSPFCWDFARLTVMSTSISRTCNTCFTEILNWLILEIVNQAIPDRQSASVQLPDNRKRVHYRVLIRHQTR